MSSPITHRHRSCGWINIWISSIIFYSKFRTLKTFVFLMIISIDYESSICTIEAFILISNPPLNKHRIHDPDPICQNRASGNPQKFLAGIRTQDVRVYSSSQACPLTTRLHHDGYSWTHHYKQKCYKRTDMAPSPTKNEARRKKQKKKSFLASKYQPTERTVPSGSQSLLYCMYREQPNK